MSKPEEVGKVEPISLTSQAYYDGSNIPPGKASVSDSQGILKKTKPDLSGEEPITILQWTSGRKGGLIKKCDVPCFHTTDRSDATLSTVGAVVFDIPSYGGNPRSALKGKASQALTVGLSMESSKYYIRQKNLSDYNLTITCSFDLFSPGPHHSKVVYFHRRMPQTMQCTIQFMTISTGCPTLVTPTLPIMLL